MSEIEIVENASDSDIAAWLQGRLASALETARGQVAITVPGGSTPFPILRELTEAPLDWKRLTVWPGDDRVVAEDHEASNTGRIRALLEPAGATIVSLPDADSEAAAVPPRFAVAWLGMGTDGHIASLFPNTDPRTDDTLAIRRLTPDPLPPEAPFDRITLTMPALLASEEVMFVIRGEDKRAVFEAAMRAESDTPVARFLAAARQKVTCFT